MELFFFGVSENSSRKAIESFSPRKFNVMINYASKVKPVPKNTDKLFIDSGGFSFFFKLSEFPDPHEKYLEFVLKKGADFFANRDYPCEPELTKKWGRTVRDNQLKTIENQIEIMELIDDQYPELKKRFVAVIQGWTLDDYLWMIDYMKEHGLLTKLTAIGSVCRRGKEQQIRKYILAIRKEIPRRYKLHGFGVKFGVLKYKDVWDALYSADSLAYRYWVSRQRDSRPINVQIREQLERWLKKLEYYQRKHSRQQIIIQSVRSLSINTLRIKFGLVLRCSKWT